MRSFTYSQASSSAEAISQCSEGRVASYLAGGTTLIDLVKLDVMQPRHVVDINRIKLDTVEALTGGGLKIGATVRNSDLAWHADVRKKFPVLAEALLSGASAQIRNMATLAGNLMQRTRCAYFRDGISSCNKREPGSGCAALEGFNRAHAILGVSDSCIATHPSDMCVALAILDAEIVIQNSGGERTIPLLDFHLLPGNTPEREHALRPGELITAVIIRPLPDETRSWYVKLRDRESYEFALASVAVALRMDGQRIREARIALGGVATKPWRAREAEAALLGERAEEANFQRASRQALDGAKPRKFNAFKIELAQRAMVRALSLVAAGQPAVRTT